MTDLIPLLARTSTSNGGNLVPSDFVTAFVSLHDHDWNRAQAHWERIIERVLDTDAVDPRATGRRAIRQAVQATVILLSRSDLRGRCPFCPRATGHAVPAARGGADD